MSLLAPLYRWETIARRGLMTFNRGQNSRVSKALVLRHGVLRLYSFSVLVLDRQGPCKSDSVSWVLWGQLALLNCPLIIILEPVLEEVMALTFCLLQMPNPQPLP